MNRFYTKKFVLLAFALLVGFMVVVLPWMANMVLDTVGDISSPDTSFIYSKADLYQMAGDYGQEGRQLYVIQRFTFDIVWPLVYGMFILTTVGYTFKGSKYYKFMILLPFLAVGFDYLENIGSGLTFLIYPSKSEFLLFLTPGFTFMKWIFVSIGFVLSIALFLRIFLRRSE